MFALSMPSRRALTGIVSLILVGMASAGAQAQTAPAKDAPAATKPAGTQVFIVIDADRIRRESLAGKSLNSEAERYGKSIEDENRKEEAPMRAAELDLQKQRGTLPADQFAEKARTFEQKVADMQRMELKRQQAFEKSLNTASRQWQQAMMEASRDVAAQHNADAVLQSQALFFYNTGWDVTNEVIDLMNKRLTKVDFPPPKVEADAPGTQEPPGSTLKPQTKELQPGQPQLKLPAQ